MPSTPRAQRQAETHDRDVTRVANAATAPLGGVSIKVRASVLRAMRANRDIGKAIRDAMEPMRVPLTQAMTASFVVGAYRARITAEKHLAGKRLSLANEIADPLGRWDKIVDFAVRRVAITEAELAGLTQTFAVQADAGVLSMASDLQLKINKAIAQAVAAGEHREGTIAAVRRAFDAAGVTNAHPFLIETQARTQTQLAYSAGRLAANQDPDIDEILWGYTFATVGDDRVRPSHAALDGMTLPKEHPRWQECMPPLGFNCRCTVIEVFKGEEYAAIDNPPEYVIVDGARVRAGADEGFDFNPLDVFNGQLAGV